MSDTGDVYLVYDSEGYCWNGVEWVRIEDTLNAEVQSLYDTIDDYHDEKCNELTSF